MKKLLIALLSLCMLFCMCFAVACEKSGNKTTSVGLEYTLINGDTEYEVKSIGTCKDTDVIIPSTYNDKPVTSIGEGAFSGCSSLTNITIPDSVTSIGSFVFSTCNSLSDITYTGTIEQWNAIRKVSYWNKNTGDYTIHCTDGDIAKA